MLRNEHKTFFAAEIQVAPSISSAAISCISRYICASPIDDYEMKMSFFQLIAINF